MRGCFYNHRWTQMDTDGKDGSTVFDANCANYRQLNSRQFAKFASRPYPSRHGGIRGGKCSQKAMMLSGISVKPQWIFCPGVFTSLRFGVELGSQRI